MTGLKYFLFTMEGQDRLEGEANFNPLLKWIKINKANPCL